MPQIKSTRTFTSILHSGSTEVVKEYLSEEEVFDMNKNILFQKIINEKGFTESLYLYKYDDKNNLVEVLHYLDDGETIATKTSYSYSESGELIAEKLVYSDGSVEEKKKSSEELKNIWTTYDEDGEIIETEEEEINTSERLTRSVRKNSEGIIIYSSEKIINEKNEVIESIVHEEYREPMKTQFTYNTDGQLIKEVYLNLEGTILETIEFEINERGQIKSEKSSLVLHRNYFNEDGLLEKSESTSIEENMVEAFSEYVYDKHQNVIEEVNFSLGERYEMEPGVQARTKSRHTRTRYEYEFWDEALAYASV